MLFYELLAGEAPFQDKTNPLALVEAVKLRQERPAIPDSCREHHRKLLQEMWSEHPSSRPALRDVSIRIHGTDSENENQKHRPSS